MSVKSIVLLVALGTLVWAACDEKKGGEEPARVDPAAAPAQPAAATGDEAAAAEKSTPAEPASVKPSGDQPAAAKPGGEPAKDAPAAGVLSAEAAALVTDGKPDWDKVVALAEKTGAAVCACKDKACAQAQMAGMMKVMAELQQRLPGQQPPPEFRKKMNEVGSALMKCMMDLEGAAKEGGADAADDKPGVDGAAVIELAEEATTDVCACQDVACGSARMEAFGKEMMKYKPADLSPAVAAKVRETAKRMSDCMQKLGAPRP